MRRGEKCTKSSPGNANIKFKALTLKSGTVIFEETKQAITVSGGVQEGKRAEQETLCTDSSGILETRGAAGDAQ